MSDLLTLGAFIGGIWALSLLGLKSIRDSDRAEDPLKDASGAAIVATNLIGSMAVAFVLGVQEFNTWGGGVLAALVFTVPFLAMWVVYKDFKWWKFVVVIVGFLLVVVMVGLGTGSNQFHLGDTVAVDGVPPGQGELPKPGVDVLQMEDMVP